MINKILIIEDNVAEAIYAQVELAKAGLADFRAVTTLSEGLEAMSQYDAVLSDLFFPAGSISTEQYSQRFLPLYEQFKQKSFSNLGKDNAVLGAVQACADAFSITPQAWIDIMAKMNTHPKILKAARDSLSGINDSEKYEAFLKIEEGIRNGTNLPLGIIAAERAKELGIPSTIVTSTYHHNHAFEPVRDLIKVAYRDTLVDGRKDWKVGIELLLR